MSDKNDNSQNINSLEAMAFVLNPPPAKIYSTEMIEKILTSASARRMIQRITPKYGNSSIGLKLINVKGLENDRIADMILDFARQAVPQEATWSIPIWERSLGIIPQSENWEINTQNRRQEIIIKLRARAPMNPAKINRIISEIAGVGVDGGAVAEMDEYYYKGIDDAGKPRELKNTFFLEITPVAAYKNSKSVWNKLREIKQTHRTFIIEYGQRNSFPNPDKYSGYISGGVCIKRRIVIGTEPAGERYLSHSFTLYTGGRIHASGQLRIPQQEHNTYGSLKRKTYGDIRNKTYSHIFQFKED